MMITTIMTITILVKQRGGQALLRYWPRREFDYTPSAPGVQRQKQTIDQTID